MRISRNVRRTISVTLAGAAVVGVAALPASAATASPAARPAVVSASPARQQVRVDIAITPASLPAGARAVLVRDVTAGTVVGVFPLRTDAVTHVTVTVPAGTTLDISALTSANANRPARLGTVRVVVGAQGSTAAGNTVAVTFRRGEKPRAAASAQLGRQGAKVSVL